MHSFLWFQLRGIPGIITYRHIRNRMAVGQWTSDPLTLVPSNHKDVFIIQDSKVLLSLAPPASLVSMLFSWILWYCHVNMWGKIFSQTYINLAAVETLQLHCSPEGSRLLKRLSLAKGMLKRQCCWAEWAVFVLTAGIWFLANQTWYKET